MSKRLKISTKYSRNDLKSLEGKISTSKTENCWRYNFWKQISINIIVDKLNFFRRYITNQRGKSASDKRFWPRRFIFSLGYNESISFSLPTNDGKIRKLIVSFATAVSTTNKIFIARRNDAIFENTGCGRFAIDFEF